MDLSDPRFTTSCGGVFKLTQPVSCRTANVAVHREGNWDLVTFEWTSSCLLTDGQELRAHGQIQLFQIGEKANRGRHYLNILIGQVQLCEAGQFEHDRRDGLQSAEDIAEIFV